MSEIVSIDRVARRVSCLICNERRVGGIVVVIGWGTELGYCLPCARGIRDALKKRPPATKTKKEG